MSSNPCPAIINCVDPDNNSTNLSNDVSADA